MDIKTITSQLNAIKRTCLFCNSHEELANRTGIQSLKNNNNFDKVGEDKRVAIYEEFNEEYQTYAESPSVRLCMEKPCARDPRSPVPLTLAVQNSLTL